MQSIGTQVKLPMRIALQITLEGIRIRLGRALVTISGVTLGIAFLMSVMTGELVKAAVDRQKEFQQTVRLMNTLVASETGLLEGKTLGVAVFGKLSREESAMLKELSAGKPKSLRTYGLQLSGITKQDTDLKSIGQGASLLLILGDQTRVPASLAELSVGMLQSVVMDSRADRHYQGKQVVGVRRELFFGEQSRLDKVEAAKKAVQDRFRTIWIVCISLLVTVIGISNALLMSVTERFKEIGTMKCLGALSSFIRRLFLVESALIGVAGSVLGVILGIIIPLLAYGFSFGFELVFGSMKWLTLIGYGFTGIVVGTVLAMLAAIYPANFAARMVPAMALRSNV